METKPVINYRGRQFYFEETEELTILTSVEKKNGRYVILEFTKDQEKSDKAIQAFKDILRKSIIENHFNGVS